MTVLATAISRYGIVQAVDARVSSHPRYAAAGTRIFSIGFANAALSATGSYSVDGHSLHEWMTAQIDDYALSTKQPTLSGLAHRLREGLTPQAEPIHRRMIHIAGYAYDGDKAHPEFYFVRNFRGITADGRYEDPGPEFFVDEKYWSCDHLDELTRKAAASGGAHLYIDGAPDARIAYMVLNQRLHDFYLQLWASSERFRKPQNLQDMATLVEVDLRLTAAFLGSPGDASMASAQGIDLMLIAAPSDAVAL